MLGRVCRVLGVVSAAFVVVAVTGCGVGATGGGQPLSLALSGHAMGGQQPVSGAIMALYAASTTGYGAASISKLTTSVNTDINGGFVLTNKYTCGSADDLMYLVATQGNPGLSGVNNTQIGLMAALGRCGDLLPTTNIIVNEVTTVAAAWSLAQFMPTYDHLATSSTNIVGLKNAFGMAANLASFARGMAPGDAPANAVVPADEINTLANALAACINSSGGVAGDATTCGKLMTAAKVGGIAPTNTIDAALNIARNPGANVEDIYDLPTGDAPFQPTLAQVPNDWTVAVSFPTGPTVAANIAIDANGNVWSVAHDALYELNAAGFQQTSYSSLAGNAVAFDPSGNIWVAITGTSQIAKMPANLSAPVFYNAVITGSDNSVSTLAIDGSGNVWYSCGSCTNVNEMGADGSAKATSPTTGGSGIVTSALSIDKDENVWVGNFTYPGYYVLKPDATFSTTGQPFSCGGNCGVSSFIANDHAGQGWFIGHDLTIASGGTLTDITPPTGGIDNPTAVAIDGAGAGWVANNNSITNATAGSISAFTTSGGAISSSTGYVSSTLSTPQGIAVDGSGNVWVRNSGAPTVTVFVGAATPVITPFSVGLKNGTLGQKP